MTTQKQYLLKYFQKNKSEWIPIYKFIELGIYRYGARIFELRKEGYDIESKEKYVKHPIFRGQRNVWYRFNGLKE